MSMANSDSEYNRPESLCRYLFRTPGRSAGTFSWRDERVAAVACGRMAATYPDVTLIRLNKDHRDCRTPGIRRFAGLEIL